MRLISDRTGTHSEAPRHLERRPLDADRHWRMLQSTWVRLHAALAKRSEHCALAVVDGGGGAVSWRSAADCGVDVQEGWRRRPGGAVSSWGSTAIQNLLDGDRRVLGFVHITRRVQGAWEVACARRLTVHAAGAPAQVAR